MEKKRTIVVVDDSRIQAELLEDFLKESGFEVHLAFTAQEGLKKIVDRRPDMALLDLYLPDMMGSDLCSQLRSNDATRDIPIILCTAHKISFTEKMKGFRAGVDDYLIKPFELSELLARIHAVLRRTATSTAATIASRTASAQTFATPTFAPAGPPASLRAGSSEQEPLKIFARIWDVLNFPSHVFENMKENADFLLSLLLVLGTPAIASFSRLAQRSSGFDSWVGVFSLGLVVHLVMWFGTAGLLHLVLPFQGATLSLKKALALAGLGWAPRFLGSLFVAIYSFIALTGWVGEHGDFSAGVDLIPGMPSSDWITFLSHVGLFDVWCAWITLVGVWTLCNLQRRRWSAITVIIGLSCLIFGAFTNY